MTSRILRLICALFLAGFLVGRWIIDLEVDMLQSNQILEVRHLFSKSILYRATGKTWGVAVRAFGHFLASSVLYADYTRSQAIISTELDEHGCIRTNNNLLGTPILQFNVTLLRVYKPLQLISHFAAVALQELHRSRIVRGVWVHVRLVLEQPETSDPL
jgi:hypothetical protein